MTAASTVDVYSTPIHSGDTLLVHFEPGIMPDRMRDYLRDIRLSGVKVVFCCHRFDQAILSAWGFGADRFVVHRNYGISDSRVVEIPLGCPVYTSTETPEGIRIRMGLPTDRIIAITIGFLASWKRLPELARALAAALGDSNIFIVFQTPLPFQHEGTEEANLRGAMASFKTGSAQLSTNFIGPKDLLDLTYSADLGFFFHPIHTGSVSAATKQLISVRRPMVVTASSHAADLRQGVERIATFDPATFARHVVHVASDPVRLKELKTEATREYERINMDVVAAQYLELFEGLG